MELQTFRNSLGRVLILRFESAWKLLVLLVVLFSFVFFCGSIQAHQMALLVGASSYPGIPGNDLKGPGPDVIMMRRVLLQIGVPAENVEVLADDVPAAARPTRAAIFSSISKLFERASSGDTVIIYFAGHGSNQPAKPEDIGKRSVDGLDATFLPSDTERASPGELPKNVIVNYEVANWIRQFQSKGAFVWLIFDSCHSGYIDRGSRDPNVRDRFVPPEALGITAEQLDDARRQAQLTGGGVSRGVGNPLSGEGTSNPNYVGFFAAQATETTPEFPLPDGQSEIHGIFTYILSQALLSNLSASFAQLRDSVLQEYLRLRRTYPTPAFDGTGLDRSLLGEKHAIRQWTVQSDGSAITVGLLSGVTKESLLSVFASALASDQDVLGYVRVTEATPFSATVEPIAHASLQALPRSEVQGKTVRLAEPAVDFVLRLAPPIAQVGGGTSVSGRLITDILEQVRAKHSGDTHIYWVGPGSLNADINLVVDDGQIWFAGRDTSYVKSGDGKTASVVISTDPTKTANEVSEVLSKMARVINLTRIAANFPREVAEGLQLDLLLERDSASYPEALSIGQDVKVVDGDKLQVKIQNKGTYPYNVTVMYFDAHYSPQCFFPNPNLGERPRLEAGTGIKTFRIAFNANPTGVERVFFIATKSRAGQPDSNYCFLADTEYHNTRGSTDALSALLSKAGFPELGRRGSTMDASSVADSWIQFLDFRVGKKS